MAGINPSATGLAPTSTGGANVLPPLDGAAPSGDASAGGAAAPGAAGTTDTSAAGNAAENASPLATLGITKLPTWLGPLTIVAGGGAAIAGFTRAAANGGKGAGLLKFGGIAAALAGVGLTYVASKQAGAAAQEAKDTASFKAYDAQATAVITELQNRVATAGQTPQTPGANGADPSTATPNADGTTQTAPGTTDPGATTPGTNAQASPGGAGSEIPPNIIVAVPPKAVPSGSVAAGAWNPSTLIGSSMQLPAGQGANASTPLAAAGTFVVQTPVGDVNGYATAAEANAAAKAPIDTTSSGLPYLRFVVVQHGGRYYAALAKATDGSPSKPLDAATGTVASWHAAQYVSGGSGGSWQVYTWDQQAGASAVDVGYTPEPFAPGATGSTNATGQSTISGGPAPGVPAPGTPGVPTPGSAPTIGSAPAPGTTPGVANPSAAAAPFDPSSVIGASFALNAASTAEGDIVRGGSLQVQSFVSSSTGGFGTAEDAAVAARAERAAIGTDPWKRIVTVQGADNRFYVYTGSIVSRATQAPSGAAPVHVFASGVAEYFDGATASWKAVRDNK